VRTVRDALLSVRRYIALIVGDDWEVRLADDEGMAYAKIATVGLAGPPTFSGPAHIIDVTQPVAVSLFQGPEDSDTEAMLAALDLQERAFQAFRLGVSYEECLMPPRWVSGKAVAGGGVGTGSYLYTVSCLTDRGESLPSAAAASVVLGALGTVTLSWEEIPGALGYRVYRDGLLLAEVSSTSYIDTGSVVPSGAPPLEPSSWVARKSAPLRVPLYDYEGFENGDLVSYRHPSDYLRILDFAPDVIADADDHSNVAVVLGFRMVWRRMGRVSSGVQVVQELRQEYDPIT
jgi:hypothetical protein